jgi:hypothetical protein
MCEARLPALAFPRRRGVRAEEQLYIYNFDNVDDAAIGRRRSTCCSHVGLKVQL